MAIKQTKIICTLADNRCDPDFIRQLIESGMDVVRLNTAHMDIASADKVIAAIRSVSDRVGILLDTKGPEVRTCNLTTPIQLKTGNRVEIGVNHVPEEKRIEMENLIVFIGGGHIKASQHTNFPQIETPALLLKQ